MKEDYTNPATYLLTDRITGEEIDIDFFIEKVTKNGWEKCYVKTMADFVGITGAAPSKVLSYILMNKTANNLILGTVVFIAKEAGVSPQTVSTVFKLLADRKLLKLIRSGCYMLNPDIIRHGSRGRGVVLFRAWGD